MLNGRRLARRQSKHGRARRKNGMMQHKRQVEVVALPIAISTLIIDGKRLSPSVFKQIASEPLIDEENGQLRGVPLGWVNLHQKDCPEHEHLHILWMRDHALRLAIVAGPATSTLYRQKEHASLARRRHLTDLLAYLLGLDFRYKASTYQDKSQRLLKIDTYTLPVAISVAHLLDALEEARTCAEQEAARWKSAQQQPGSLDQALAGARLLQEQLEPLHIRLTHPALYNHRDKRLGAYARTGDDDDDEGLRVYRRYDDDIAQSPKRLAHLQQPTQLRPKTGKWFVFQEPGGEKDRQILWHTPASLDEEEILTIEQQLSEHLSALLVSLAQQTVERDTQAVRVAIEELQTHLSEHLPSPFASPPKTKQKETKTALTADAIFSQYEHEKKLFDAYTQGWQQIITDLQASEQLFIIT
jgi:hypothetical protein